MKKIAFLLLFAAWGLQADDIYLKNGIIYRNVKIIIQTDRVITYQTAEGKTFSVGRNVVKEVLTTEFNPAVKSDLGSSESMVQHNYQYPNIRNLVYSIPPLVVSIDYFIEASDIGKSIKKANDDNVDTDDLKKRRSRKTIAGAFLIGAAVWNAAISLERVEVTADGNMIGLSYKF